MSIDERLAQLTVIEDSDTRGNGEPREQRLLNHAGLSDIETVHYFFGAITNMCTGLLNFFMQCGTDHPDDPVPYQMLITAYLLTLSNVRAVL